jgi:hypothetical protein
MRAMRLFLGFSAASALVGAVASGCSSSSSPAAAAQDSGSGDVTMEAMPQPEAASETGPDVVDSGPDICVPDTSVSSIAAPDAALNDAGATAAGCMMCVAQSPGCSQLVAECNESCVCIAAFQMFSQCLSSPGGSLFACTGTLQGLAASGIDASTTPCVASCATACGYTPSSGDGGEAGGD